MIKTPHTLLLIANSIIYSDKFNKYQIKDQHK